MAGICLYVEDGVPGLPKIRSFIRDTFNLSVVLKKGRGILKTQGLILDIVNTHKAWRKAVEVKAADRWAIIITRRLFATPDSVDKRLHLRAALFSYPSIISLSGIVEAAAKPREYYLARQSLQGSGLWPIEEARIKRRLAARFIDHGDARIPEVVKGLSSQAIFFWLTGNPFCQRKSCRLYNAHWQEDLIYSQIKSGRFCRGHSRRLKRLKEKIQNGGRDDRKRKSGKGPE
ncbi:MAG: DUF6775 family putative metallopeptidase [Candidatus Omnitrophota bacterium]